MLMHMRKDTKMNRRSKLHTVAAAVALMMITATAEAGLIGGERVGVARGNDSVRALLEDFGLELRCSARSSRRSMGLPTAYSR
jgi:hypothetical protein